MNGADGSILDVRHWVPPVGPPPIAPPPQAQPAAQGMVKQNSGASGASALSGKMSDMSLGGSLRDKKKNGSGAGNGNGDEAVGADGKKKKGLFGKMKW